jgi:hypothetical protein
MGCPGHTMTLVWHHTSDTVDVQIDGVSWFVLDDAKLETLVKLAQDGQEQRL